MVEQSDSRAVHHDDDGRPQLDETPVNDTTGNARNALLEPNKQEGAHGIVSQETQMRQQQQSSSTDHSFMRQVERTVQNVLFEYPKSCNVHELPPTEREAVLVARCLQGRLDTARQNKVCDQCWLQLPHHCICAQCPSVEPLLRRDRRRQSDTIRTSTTSKSDPEASDTPPKLRRLFLVMHYREIFMAVDTAKLILLALPQTARLVISGIPARFQASMTELENAIQNPRCLVLFPDEGAETFVERERAYNETAMAEPSLSTLAEASGWDIVVIDGTWQQARRIKLRYFSACPATTKLSSAALAHLEGGRDDANERGQTDFNSTAAGDQLRKHSVPWRKIATFEAARLFLADLLDDDYQNYDIKDHVRTPWVQMRDYLRIANEAALNRKGSTPWS